MSSVDCLYPISLYKFIFIMKEFSISYVLTNSDILTYKFARVAVLAIETFYTCEAMTILIS